ncbi:MAG: glycosyltransferase [Candidatus Magasanikbacteria bacterium]|nr:glycosyltransferase [Candidatus Magasanikbacteria bacterium]
MATSTFNSTRKKVLITYATGGMGHVSAAKAIAEVFAKRYPDVEVKNIDIIDFASTVYKKVFVDGYNYISAKKPEVWGFLYRWFNKPASQKLPSELSRLAIEKKFIPFIQDFKPDFIVATHPLPMMLVSASKRKDVINIKSSMVVTDFGCHSFWVDSEVNYYFVATQNVKKCMSGYNVSLDKIIVTGIPIQAKFSQSLDRKVIAKKIGINEELFTMLMVGGQFDFLSLKKIVAGVKAESNDVQFLLVAGRDQDLKKALDNSNLGQDQKIKIFGFVDNMEELMTVCDVIFSKAGGLTVSECLAKGLPMIINKVIPGQEEDNADFLVAKKAAIKATSLEEIINSVGKLIEDRGLLAEMKKSAQAIGRPDSTTELVDFVYQQLSVK